MHEDFMKRLSRQAVRGEAKRDGALARNAEVGQAEINKQSMETGDRGHAGRVRESAPSAQ